MRTMMSSKRFETATRIIHPVITLVINTFTTQEIHELHTWQSAEYTVSNLTNQCYQETTLKNMKMKSHHIEYLKW